MRRQIPDTFAEPDPMKLCDHLEAILVFLTKERNLVVTGKENGKGWGLGLFVSGPIPFERVSAEFDVPKFISVSAADKTIFCSRCWKNIADSAKYTGNWG